ncbi:hypothetical protein BC936DRAFT_148325 [Jimgerdemannia flammicorona]|uniref:Uncharacterized protein n=1 Tax=Jimgerdemannia flammicorona TaxID=994334 RepID=A0A433D393_9FUNG|nr:hypothetical protein BC936DRAFT_148325 [Jimgerdemannia flammicorona]
MPIHQTFDSLSRLLQFVYGINYRMKLLLAQLREHLEILTRGDHQQILVFDSRSLGGFLVFARGGDAQQTQGISVTSAPSGMVAMEKRAPPCGVENEVIRGELFHECK